MPQRPSQPCRACAERGWIYGKMHLGNRSMESCSVCHGKGRVTIAAARVLDWRPIVHGPRRKPPVAAGVLPFENLPKLAGVSNSLQVTSNLRREA